MTQQDLEDGSLSEGNYMGQTSICFHGQLSTSLDDDEYGVKQYTRSLRILAFGPDSGQVATVDVILARLYTFHWLRGSVRVVSVW